MVTPVIRNVLFPALPKDKAMRHLVMSAAIAEVRVAVNAWAYETFSNLDPEPPAFPAHPEWADEA